VNRGPTELLVLLVDCPAAALTPRTASATAAAQPNIVLIRARDGVVLMAAPDRS
jgi:hypothetical protein